MKMVCMTYPRLVFLFLSCFIKYVMANEKQECKACVADGCTYCRSDKFFENPSVCACDLDSGFFESCDDYSFGSKPLDSNLDCTFNTHLSWLVLIAILGGAGGTLFCCIFCCCCIRSLKKSSSSGRGIPGLTISNTATAANNHYAPATATSTYHEPEPGTSAAPC